MFALSLLWTSPEINPVNGKARSIPLLNPFSVHGRVFFFSWLGFFIAFWSWLVIYDATHISPKQS
jgi:MFS transporter, NNP family, nitrate/nitrite transporter